MDINYLSPGLNELKYPRDYSRILVKISDLEYLTSKREIIVISGINEEQVHITRENITMLDFTLETGNKEKIRYSIYGKNEFQYLLGIFNAINVQSLKETINKGEIWLYFDSNDLGNLRGIKINI